VCFYLFIQLAVKTVGLKSFHSIFMRLSCGTTQLILTTTQNLLETLRQSFPTDFLHIYTLATLKLLGNLPIKDLQITYTKSAISQLLPPIPLSKNTTTTFLTHLSTQRNAMIKFMKQYTQNDQDGIIFDGTNFVNGARTNPFTQKDYTPNQKGKTQIRLIYAFSRKNQTPIYLLVTPGSVSDKTAFNQALEEIDGKDGTILLDNCGLAVSAVNAR